MSRRDQDPNAGTTGLMVPPTSYLYDAVADDLAARIARGDLAAHTILPAEARLAKEYGVSLGTARHATRLLRERGLVITVRSKGTYIANRANRADAADPGGPSVVVNGRDMTGKHVPVLVVRTETEPNQTAVQMQVTEQREVVLSNAFLDELSNAYRAILGESNVERKPDEDQAEKRCVP